MRRERMRLRTRVLLLTTAFALTLFGITFGLTWRARVAQDRWSRVVAVEMQADTILDEIIRAHNAIRAQSKFADYAMVMQLLQAEPLAKVDTTTLRSRMNEYRRNRSDDASAAVVLEAQRLIADNERDIATRLPALQRQARDMMVAGFGIAWILVICSFAVVQITLRKVVRPIEELARSAERITGGELVHAPVGGDLEIAQLGTAFNAMTDRLAAHARTDELTGLPNFRSFREHIDGEIHRAGRYPEQFGILVLDLDRFKQYNDRYGHLAGNEALASVGRVLPNAVRNVDFVARYGGEEFAVILPQIDAASMAAIAERIRTQVESIPAMPGRLPVTVSIGGAIFPADGADVDALFHAADERLYQAKAAGRNRAITPFAVPRSADRQSA